MLLKKSILPILLLSLLLCVSCFEDTDFSQIEDVSLSPVVELDLIYFDLDASSFYDEILGEELLTVRDTTVVDFINGTDTDEVLKKVALFFKFENSIPRSFDITFEFLTIENEPSYTTSTFVPEGSVLSPIQTIFIEEIELEDLVQLKMSTKLVTTVTISASDQQLTGNLNLKSKATYYLEIDL